VNGGDGSNEHPTQALSDALLMQSRLGDLHGTVIGIVGDPGTRVLRSLTLLLVKLEVKKILFLVPPGASIFSEERHSVIHNTLPSDLRAVLSTSGVAFDFGSDVLDLLVEADAIEMLPVRIPSLEVDPKSLKANRVATPERFRMTRSKIELTGSKALVLHPGPRGDELHPAVDSLPNGLYFEQVRESIFMRMAVLLALCRC